MTKEELQTALDNANLKIEELEAVNARLIALTETPPTEEPEEPIPSDPPLSECPPEPAQNPALGDKDPTWKAWLKEFQPNRFAKKFPSEI